MSEGRSFLLFLSLSLSTSLQLVTSLYITYILYTDRITSLLGGAFLGGAAAGNIPSFSNSHCVGGGTRMFEGQNFLAEIYKSLYRREGRTDGDLLDWFLLQPVSVCV